jgi:hypothetical protein
MRAFLIDTDLRHVGEVEYDGDYNSIYRLIDADLFEAVRFDPDSYDVVYVDEEGLLGGNDHGWFMIDGTAQPLKGFGLVLGGNDDGESVEPKISLEELRAKVRFFSDFEVMQIVMGNRA